MSTKLEMLRERIDLKKSASVGLLADVVDKLTDELAKLSQRITALEKRIDATAGAMRYRGEWHAGYEFDDGDLVEHAGGLHLAVQPIHDNQPPHRGNGWVTLVQGA